MAVARYYDHDAGEWVLLAAGQDGKPGASSWDDLTGKPVAYPPESHSHPQSEVEGLESALAGKASTDHTHAEYAEASRVTALEGSQPIIVSSLPSSPLPGRIYLVTG